MASSLRFAPAAALAFCCVWLCLGPAPATAAALTAPKFTAAHLPASGVTPVYGYGYGYGYRRPYYRRYGYYGRPHYRRFGYYGRPYYRRYGYYRRPYYRRYGHYGRRYGYGYGRRW